MNAKVSGNWQGVAPPVVPVPQSEPVEARSRRLPNLTTIGVVIVVIIVLGIILLAVL
jgi:hypothetical protein